MATHCARFLALVATLSIAACAPKPPVSSVRVVDDTLLSDELDGRNWAGYGRTYSENHYSPLSEISTQNVKNLRLAWTHDLGVKQRADSQPLEANGVVYVAVGLSIVQALDAKSGKEIWRYDPKVADVAGHKLRPSWGIRGLALWKDAVIVATQEGRLLSIGAKNGSLNWSVQTLDKDDETTITGAPRVFKDKVVIGFAGGDRDKVRGAVSCFDASTGKFLWRFYTVPGDPAAGFENDAMQVAAKTWSGEWWKYGGGGTVWNDMTFDPEFNRLYIGTGNGSPWNWKIRNPGGGDALFLASIVALNADTGEYVWHYQTHPNEAWDNDATMNMVLADLQVGGKSRKVLMQAPKNGFFYVLDRENGKLISAEKLGMVNWAERIDLVTGRPVEKPDIRYEKGPVLLWPGTYGVHNWEPMSHNPKSNLVYVPTIHQADSYDASGIDPKTWKPTKHGWNAGMGSSGTGTGKAAVRVPVEEFSSALVAWDPVKRAEVWKVQTPGTINGGVMSTAGNLVFQGQADGHFNAYDGSTGEKLWSFQAGVAVLGAPTSFSVDGHQYVSVLAGPISGSASATLPESVKYGWRYRDHPRRVLTFSLDGAATLPPPPVPMPEVPIHSDKFRPEARRVSAGAGLFNIHCLTCHGVGAIAGGAAPDLRASTIPLDASAFKGIVQGGAMLQSGMPHFDDVSDDDLLSIRHYIRAQAEAAQAVINPIAIR
jgi:quinohemoprotein ethanol dehydrogenase